MLKGEKKNFDSETVSTKVTKRNSDDEKVKVWLRETHSYPKQQQNKDKKISEY